MQQFFKLSEMTSVPVKTYFSKIENAHRLVCANFDLQLKIQKAIFTSLINTLKVQYLKHLVLI